MKKKSLNCEIKSRNSFFYYSVVEIEVHVTCALLYISHMIRFIWGTDWNICTYALETFLSAGTLKFHSHLRILKFSRCFPPNLTSVTPKECLVMQQVWICKSVHICVCSFHWIVTYIESVKSKNYFWWWWSCHLSHHMEDQHVFWPSSLPQFPPTHTQWTSPFLHTSVGRRCCCCPDDSCQAAEEVLIRIAGEMMGSSGGSVCVCVCVCVCV